jgi:hypothetical protein
VPKLDLGLLCEPGLACRKGSGQAVLRVDTINTVDSVQVLDEGNLEACSGTLAGRNRRVSQEVFPDLAYD